MTDGDRDPAQDEPTGSLGDADPEQDQPTGAIPVVAEPVFETPAAEADVRRCPACLSPVRQDQRYCLECGERLLADEIPPPPGVGAVSERGSAALIAAAVVLAIAGLALAWIALRGVDSGGGATGSTASTASTGSSSTGSTASTGDTTSTGSTTDTTPTTPTDTSAGGRGWPEGESGWAVILSSKSQARFEEADARAIADDASAAGIELVGVLDSSLYPSLNPGYWAVFSGPYTSKTEAQAAAEAIRGQGYPDAYPREVTP